MAVSALQGESLQELLSGEGYEVWLSISVLDIDSDAGSEPGLFSQESLLDLDCADGMCVFSVET